MLILINIQPLFHQLVRVEVGAALKYPLEEVWSEAFEEAGYAFLTGDLYENVHNVTVLW